MPEGSRSVQPVTLRLTQILQIVEGVYDIIREVFQPLSVAADLRDLFSVCRYEGRMMHDLTCKMELSILRASSKTSLTKVPTVITVVAMESGSICGG